VIIIDIILALVLLWHVIVKKQLYSPVIFWCGIWILSLTFAIIDPYEMRGVSDKGVFIIGIGTIAFVIGSASKSAYRFVLGNHKKRMLDVSANSFNKRNCYILVLVTAVFNFSMMMSALAFLRAGIAFGNLRDILFGYGEYSDISFFGNTFLSTFNSWVNGPAMSILLIILLLNLVVKQLPRLFNICVLLDLAIYVFATSGRMLIMHAVIFVFFLYFYHRIQISRKLKRGIRWIGISAIVILFVLTFFREGKTTGGVPNIYSYFCINIPLLSHWVDYVDSNNVVTYGNSFFRGILELVNFLLGKLEISTPGFWDMQEMFTLIQNRWVQVFPKNRYNAFVSCFFYFYMDFKAIGVALGSFIFGKVSKWSYKNLLKERSLYVEIIYMLIIQLIIDSFIRWQAGNFAFLVTFFYANICTRKSKKKNLQDE